MAASNIWESLRKEIVDQYREKNQRQPSRGVPRKRCSEHILQIYRRIPLVKVRFQYISTLRHGCSPLNFLHIFRTSFYKNTSGGMLLENALAETFNYYYVKLVEKYCKINWRWECYPSIIEIRENLTFTQSSEGLKSKQVTESDIYKLLKNIDGKKSRGI